MFWVAGALREAAGRFFGAWAPEPPTQGSTCLTMRGLPMMFRIPTRNLLRTRHKAVAPLSKEALPRSEGVA
ncbi:hypothetical protein GCM10027400_04170 [Pseudoxanthomonas daejeonensis]